MYTKKSEVIHGPNYPAGTWNDVDVAFEPGLLYICTYEPTTAVSTTDLTTLVTSTEESSTLTTLSNSSTQITVAMSETTTSELINLNPIKYVEVYPVVIPSTTTSTTSTELAYKTTVTDPIIVRISSTTNFDAKTISEQLSWVFK